MASEPMARNDRYEARLNLARKLTDHRDYDGAAVVFDWLRQTYPDRADLLIDAAVPLVRQADYVRLRQLFDDLDGMTAGPPVWIAAARLSAQMRRPNWELHYARRATGADDPSSTPATADACALMADLLERTGDIDGALEWATRGVAVEPHSGAMVSLAKALRRAGQSEAAHQAARAAFDDVRIRPDVRVMAGYELAALTDQADDADAAIAALTATKRLAMTLPTVPPAVERWRQVEQTGIASLTHATEEYYTACRRWQPNQPRRIALLAGHPRSGTTLLEQSIDAHSDVISAEETSVFSSRVIDSVARLPASAMVRGDPCATALNIDAAQLSAWRDDYFRTTEAVLDRPLGSHLLLEKNPSLTDLLPQFVRVFPEAKLVVALRDPRDVVISCFFLPIAINDATVSWLSLPDAASRYAFTMAHWLVCRENLDPAAWTEVKYESLVDHFEVESRRVTQFLGLDWEPAQGNPAAHARQRRVESPSYAQVTQPVHRKAVGRWKRYAKWIDELEPTLGTFLEAFNYR